MSDLDLNKHSVRVEYGRGATMHFSNLDVAVMAAIQRTGCRDAFRVLDTKTHLNLTFDDVLEVEDRARKGYR